MKKLVQQEALRLQAFGIQQGERVSFVAKIDISSILTFLSLLLLGASPCLLSHRLPKEQIPSLLTEGRISCFLEDSACKRRSTREPFPQEILLFTSGSQGKPKLVCLQEKHFLSNALGSLPSLHLSAGDHWLLSTPLFHVSGLSILFRCFLAGACVQLTPDKNVSHVSLVPTQLVRWLTREDYLAFPSLRLLLLGGAPIAESLLRRGLNKNLPIRTTYGMTEMASQITMSCQTDSLLPPHLGKPLPHREISFSNEGEILVRGGPLFSGYDKGEGAALSLSTEGWFATGDLGRLSGEGNLEYLGRKDNLFISGGENLYPEEIEKALGALPDVLFSLVVPIEDPEYGQRPVAFVHADTSLPSKEAFHEKLAPYLPRFAFPIAFYPFPPESLLETKIKRSDLQKWARTISNTNQLC